MVFCRDVATVRGAACYGVAAMRWVVPLAAAALAACVVDLKDQEPRECDETHPCRMGFRCTDGWCMRVDGGAGGGVAGGTGGGAAGGVGGGGTGGGTAGGTSGGTGGGTGGGGASTQAVWQQRLHGFSSTTILTNCALSIDPGRNNIVMATIRSARDGEDRATADMVDPSRLPHTLDGRFRGRLGLAAPLRLSDTATFAWLGTQTGRAWIELGFNAQGELVVASDPGTLTGAAVSQRYAWDGGFLNTDYVFDVSWKKGQYLRVAINGQQVGDVALAPGGASTPLDELRLGINRYDGDAGTGWSTTLSAWQLADDPTIDLGPL